MSFVHVLEITVSLIFAKYLLWATWQDSQKMHVVRYTHVVGIFAIFLEAILHRNLVMQSPQKYLVAICILLTLQMAAKWLTLYGVADIIVFFIIGLYFLFRAGVKKYLLAYFLVQALSGVLLWIVQICRHNVKGLRLGRPVAYIPYISVAFGLTNIVL